MHAILLGSGLSAFANGFELVRQIPYHTFCSAKFEPLAGHDRLLWEARHHQNPFLILSGKFHHYEGLDFNLMVAPFAYILKYYSIQSITITATSGALSPAYSPGGWYNINRVISLQPMATTEATDTAFTQLPDAVYGYQPGPSLGTRAEYKMLQKAGAQLVGMSLLPEALFFRNRGVRFSLLSLPVCQYAPIASCTEPGHDEVIRHANIGVAALIEHYQDFLNANP